MKYYQRQKGSQLILATVIITIIAMLGTSSASLLMIEIKKTKEKVSRERAFEIAESPAHSRHRHHHNYCYAGDIIGEFFDD